MNKGLHIVFPVARRRARPRPHDLARTGQRRRHHHTRNSRSQQRRRTQEPGASPGGRASPGNSVCPGVCRHDPGLACCTDDHETAGRRCVTAPLPARSSGAPRRKVRLHFHLLRPFWRTSAPSPWDDQPVREELFGVERLEVHARSLGLGHEQGVRRPIHPCGALLRDGVRGTWRRRQGRSPVLHAQSHHR